MSEVDCAIPAPSFYTTIMHYFHFITFPFYIITLIILVREKTIEFKRYKSFIIIHILLNMMNEFYVCFLMLPVTYLPHVVIRTTGWLSRWEFSGLLQYFIMVQLVIFVGVSIMRMMMFRFQVCVDDYKSHKFYTFLEYVKILLRILAFGHPILAGLFFNESLERQKKAREELFVTHFPSIPPEITCHTVVVANLDAPISKIILASYIIMVVLSFIVGNATFFYIVNYIKKHLAMSVKGVRMQRILIISLFIQGSVHSIMLTIPCVLEGVAVFWSLENNNLALIMFSMVAFHGFASTIAMIIFAKPLRDKFLFCFRARTNIQIKNNHHVMVVTAVSHSVMN